MIKLNFFSKKSKRSSWKIPNADQKNLFNDVRNINVFFFIFIYNSFYFSKYKTVLRTKITAHNPNITGTYQLEPVKYSSQIVENYILRHYLVNKIKYKENIIFII